MLERGYLDSQDTANMFNLLRPNDLIWANVVNNYLMGKKPPAFDLLYWNSDGTRMAGSAHSWYCAILISKTTSSTRQDPPKGEAIDLGRVQLAPMRSARRRTISCRGTPPGASPSSSAARAFRAGLQRAYRGDRQPAGRKGTYWITGPGPQAADPRMAQDGDPPRRKLVDGLGGLALPAVWTHGQSAVTRQRRLSAAGGCTWQLCVGEVVGTVLTNHAERRHWGNRGPELSFTGS